MVPLSSSLYYHLYPSGDETANRPTRDVNLPVVLLHGAGGMYLSWPAEVRRLPECRVYALDLPGHGKSDFVGGQQRIESYADQVREWMQTIGLHRAVFVGHSMGGAIALSLALQYPEQVLGLGLIATGARLRVHPELLSNAASAPSFYKALETLMGCSFGPQAAERLVELTSQRMAVVRPSVLYGDLLACEAFDVLDQISRIRCPSVVICGSEDQMTPPRFSQFLAESIAGAQLKIVPQAGHMVMLEQPQAVAAALAEFLSPIVY